MNTCKFFWKALCRGTGYHKLIFAKIGGRVYAAGSYRIPPTLTPFVRGLMIRPEWLRRQWCLLCNRSALAAWVACDAPQARGAVWTWSSAAYSWIHVSILTPLLQLLVATLTPSLCSWRHALSFIHYHKNCWSPPPWISCNSPSHPFWSAKPKYNPDIMKHIGIFRRAHCCL
jgi:hypothetical protein